MREDVGKMRHGMRKPDEAVLCFTRLRLVLEIDCRIL